MFFFLESFCHAWITRADMPPRTEMLLAMASDHNKPVQKAIKSKSSFLTENVTDILAITQGNKSDVSWQQYVD